MLVHGSGQAQRAWVTAEQIGNLDASREEWNALETQRLEIEAGVADRVNPVLVGLLGLGAAALLGGPTFIYSGGGKFGAITGSIAGLAGASMVVKSRNLFFEKREENSAIVSIRKAQQQLDMPRLEARHAVGVDGYNAAVGTLLERFDHDDDGAINIASGQQLARDERITAPGGSGPISDATSDAASALPLLRAADSHGNGDDRVTGDELGRFLVDHTQPRLEWGSAKQVTPDAIAALAARQDDASGVAKPRLVETAFAHQLRTRAD